MLRVITQVMFVQISGNEFKILRFHLKAFRNFSFPLQTAKNLSSSPQSTRSSSTAGCPVSTTDCLYGEPLPLESTSSFNSPQAEESETTRLSTLHESQSQSTSQFSQAQVNVYNAVPSMSVPTVFVNPYDENYEFEDCNKPDHSLHMQQDDFHPEIAAQVPFDFGQHSSGGFSDEPDIQEEDDLKEKKDVECLLNLLEEQCQKLKEEKTDTYLEASEQPPLLKKVNNDHTTEDVEEHNLTMTVHGLAEALQHPLESETRAPKVEFVSMLTAQTFKSVEVTLTVESTRKGDKDMDGSVASDHELTITEEELEPDEDPSKGERALMSTSDHQTTLEETLEKASVSEASSTSPDFAFDSQPSTVLSSTEEDLTCQRDERAPQTCKDSETKPPLPRKSSIMSTVSKNETEVALERCVTASFTFCSAAVCLAVGFQEPSIFLVVGLFLLSLCF